MSYTVLTAAVSGILDRKSFCAHREAFFDVEPLERPAWPPIVGPETFALVFRSADKAIIGKTDSPACAEFVFNDPTGAKIPIVLAEAPAGPGFTPPTVLVDAAADLVAFYRSNEPFAVRFAKLGTCARDVLPMVVAMLNGAKWRKSFKIGHFHALDATVRSTVRSLNIETAAKVLANADALAAALASVAGRTGAPLSPEFLARVQQVWAMVGSAA